MLHATQQDLVSFGNYLLERYGVYRFSDDGRNEPLHQRQVSHADIQNWIDGLPHSPAPEPQAVAEPVHERMYVAGVPAVTAKFVVGSVLNMATGVCTINLDPVRDGSPENKAFYAATPGGAITLQVVNPTTGAFFKPGGEYLVDFTPATKYQDPTPEYDGDEVARTSGGLG